MCSERQSKEWINYWFCKFCQSERKVIEPPTLCTNLSQKRVKGRYSLSLRMCVYHIWATDIHLGYTWKKGNKKSHTYHKRYLQQRGEFILGLYTRLRMYQTALVAQWTIASDEHIAGDCLSKRLHVEYVRNDILSFLCEWVMHFR